MRNVVEVFWATFVWGVLGVVGVVLVCVGLVDVSMVVGLCVLGVWFVGFVGFVVWGNSRVGSVVSGGSRSEVREAVGRVAFWGWLGFVVCVGFVCGVGLVFWLSR